MKSLVREKKHRLNRELYKGLQIVAFTLCIKDHKKFFISEKIFKEFERMLLVELQRFQSSADVYLFMPDHCHLLLRGNSDESDVLLAVKYFKQKSGYWFSKHSPQVHWQKDFYDHILRSEKEAPKQINYILNNPVRKEMTVDWKAYSFKGSTIHNFVEW
ncbi:MAG TPA: transposase [Bacteroidota bacterium]